jgi:hypothetical protein
MLAQPIQAAVVVDLVWLIALEEILGSLVVLVVLALSLYVTQRVRWTNGTLG